MQTTRRDVLTHGGKVIATVAVLPFLPSIAHAEDDAGLFAQYEKCRQLETEFMAATNRYEEVSFAVPRRFQKGKAPQMVSRWSFLKGLINQLTEQHIQRSDIQRIKDVADEICDIEKKWEADLAEAEERAGVPALKKKQDTACNAWEVVLNHFFTVRAHTPAGMILKFRIAWCDKQEREWQATHSHRDVEFWDDAMASVLMDLESLSGRRV